MHSRRKKLTDCSYLCHTLLTSPIYNINIKLIKWFAYKNFFHKSKPGSFFPPFCRASPLPFFPFFPPPWFFCIHNNILPKSTQNCNLKVRGFSYWKLYGIMFAKAKQGIRKGEVRKYVSHFQHFPFPDSAASNASWENLWFSQLCRNLRGARRRKFPHSAISQYYNKKKRGILWPGRSVNFRNISERR